MEAAPKFTPLPKALELEFAEGTEVLLLPQRKFLRCSAEAKEKKEIKKRK